MQLDWVRTSVKRETGANPVRSRHCKSGVWKHGVSQSLGNREGVFTCKWTSQETCLLLVRKR